MFRKFGNEWQARASTLSECGAIRGNLVSTACER